MKKLIAFTGVIWIISMLLMVLYFMASSDIYHDYVGTYIRSEGYIGHAANLPEWAKCKGEWSILNMDYIIRFILMMLVAVVLLKLFRREKASVK
jgi:hypothetical protein